MTEIIKNEKKSLVERKVNEITLGNFDCKEVKRFGRSFYLGITMLNIVKFSNCAPLVSKMIIVAN